MYSAVLALHSLLRWVVLLAALAATATALRGWLGGRPFTKGARLSGVALVASIDLQVLLGLLLYFALSPFVRAALAHPAAAMAEPGLRYWFVEHPVPALLAAVLAHLGSVLGRRAPDDAARLRRTALAYGAALLLAAVAVPWPFVRFGRPLWPL